MYTYCNAVYTNNGVLVSTHASHWQAVKAMLATPDDVRAVLEALPPGTKKQAGEAQPMILERRR